MGKLGGEAVIRLRGVRHNNLKNFDLDLPLGKLVVVTGLSGSGKSSLAFDTLYAEGQRRYIETFSPYARQFFDRMDKPQVDSISGIPPAIALEQRNSVKSSRSTVGTMTEMTDYMKVLWPFISTLYCQGCGRVVRKDGPEQIWNALGAGHSPTSEWLITFSVALSDQMSLRESLGLVGKQGYQRLLIADDGGALQVVRVEEAEAELRRVGDRRLVVIQDRLSLQASHRSRFVEALEQAYHLGKGRLAVYGVRQAEPIRFSRHRHCAECDLNYPEPSAGLFSFNNPVGACPECKGYGRKVSIDYGLAIPDRSLSLKEGAVKPWQTETGAESQGDLVKACRKHRVPMDVPFAKLPAEQQQWVIEGDPGYGTSPSLQWPKAWYGLKGYFRMLEARAYKMHVRVLLARYRAYTICPQCLGSRFKPESLRYQATSPEGFRITLAEFYQLTVTEALRFVAYHAPDSARARSSDPLRLSLGEVSARLSYLEEVGLGYLTLERPTRTLSGGETERVNLTTCLGSRLVNTLFVLDEPSVGLHASDTERLVTILKRLRDRGNTVVVVEHEASVMRAADQIIDLGPGHGESGGHLIFQGTYGEILQHTSSLTGGYLAGRVPMEDQGSRKPDLTGYARMVLSQVSLFNLRDLTVSIPLGALVCVTGVSGSGKSTLVRHVLYPLLEARGTPEVVADASETDDEDHDATPPLEGGSMEQRVGLLEGAELVGQVILVDQSSLGRTPRSNPAVYTGAFDHLRDLFAASEEAQAAGLTRSAFSFNSDQGRCEQCRGAGFEKIEMQFLSDVFIRCPECQGRRYRPHVIDVKLSPRPEIPWSIADLLEASVDEAIVFLRLFPDSKPAVRALGCLGYLQEVGLGYVCLGQPINTLSGGECQRLKLVRHLAAFEEGNRKSHQPAVFIFDEPTTGLHFEDVRILMRALRRLVTAGHSLIVVEHNLQVIRMADWIIDLGPGAGADGGRIVVEGTPETVTECAESLTGAALRQG